MTLKEVSWRYGAERSFLWRSLELSNRDPDKQALLDKAHAATMKAHEAILAQPNEKRGSSWAKSKVAMKAGTYQETAAGHVEAAKKCKELGLDEAARAHAAAARANLEAAKVTKKKGADVYGKAKGSSKGQSDRPEGSKGVRKDAGEPRRTSGPGKRAGSSGKSGGSAGVGKGHADSGSKLSSFDKMREMQKELHKQILKLDPRPEKAYQASRDAQKENTFLGMAAKHREASEELKLVGTKEALAIAKLHDSMAGRADKEVALKAKGADRTKAVEVDEGEGHWITLKGGQHVFVKEGQSVHDAIDDHFKSKIGKLKRWTKNNPDHPLLVNRQEDLKAHIKAHKDWMGGSNPVVAGDDDAVDASNTNDTFTPPVLMDGRPGLTQEAPITVIPKQLLESLSPEQRQGAALAITAMRKPPGGFLLADGTGAGKTREQLAVAQAFAEKGVPVIIVSQAGIIKANYDKDTVEGSFRDDSHAMGIELHTNDGSKEIGKGEIHITSYSRLREIAEQFRDTEPKPVVIWDEAHNLKNDSGRAAIGKFMNDRAEGVLFASATPCDKPMHLAYLERTGIFGADDPDSARRALGMTKRVDSAGQEHWSVNPAIGKNEVANRMQKVFDSLTRSGGMCKREINMDSMTTDIKTLPVPPEGRQKMADIEQMYADLPLKGGNIFLQQRRATEYYKLPMVAANAKATLDAGGQSVIFIDCVNGSTLRRNGIEVEIPSSVEELKRQLIARGIKEEDIVEAHGGVSGPQQIKGMARFQSGDAKVIIGSVGCAGTGVNLDDRRGDRPRTTEMVTPPLSPVDSVQVGGRTLRATTKSDPKMNFYFGDTPNERKNASLLAGKMAQLHAAVNGQVDILNVPTDLSEDGVAEFLQQQEEGGSEASISARRDTDWTPSWQAGSGWRPPATPSILPPPKAPRVPMTPEEKAAAKAQKEVVRNDVKRLQQMVKQGVRPGARFRDKYKEFITRVKSEGGVSKAVASVDAEITSLAGKTDYASMTRLRELQTVRSKVAQTFALSFSFDDDVAKRREVWAQLQSI